MPIFQKQNGKLSKISAGESSTIRTKKFTTIIEREGDGYVALCPELDIAGQGDSSEEARNNLTEALELFFEVAKFSEIQNRFYLFEVI